MVNFQGLLDELSGELHEIMYGETRLWLLEKLLSRQLVTWDIYYFAVKQAGLRDSIKSLDWPTMVAALRVKIRDIASTLTRHRRKKSQLELEMNNLLNWEKGALKKVMRPLLKPIRDEKRTRLKKFERKIEHYREKQKLTPVREPVHDYGSLSGKTVTRVPRRLVEYTGLRIFGGTQALPKKEPTVGAFIGSKSMVFTEDERLLLDKDPKFSVRTSVDIMDFKIELERMCGKQRYGQFENDKDFSKRPKIITAEQGEIKLRLEEERAKTGDDTELHLDPRIKDLEDEWKKMNESLVYDPIKNRIDFNKRRVSDYKTKE